MTEDKESLLLLFTEGKIIDCHSLIIFILANNNVCLMIIHAVGPKLEGLDLMQFPVCIT